MGAFSTTMGASSTTMGASSTTMAYANGRFIEHEHNRRVSQIQQDGQPCYLFCCLDSSNGRAKIETVPMNGWIHLCTDQAVADAPWQYHISLGFNDGTVAWWRTWAALFMKWDGKAHTLRIDRVSRNCTMMLAPWDPLYSCPCVKALRLMDTRHNAGGYCLSISAWVGCTAPTFFSSTITQVVCASVGLANRCVSEI